MFLLSCYRRTAVETGFGNQHEPGGHRGGRRRVLRVQNRRQPAGVQSDLEAQRELFTSRTRTRNRIAVLKKIIKKLLRRYKQHPAYLKPFL